MAPTTRAEDPPPARLLDVTRLVSRAGRVLTGVDRVERAWLVELLDRDTPVFALLRTPAGHLLLDRSGAAELRDRLGTGRHGRPDALSRLGRARPREVQALESRLRAVALGRAPRWGLSRLLRRHLPDGTAYINTGISNLTPTVLRAMDRLSGGRVTVFVHDTIPLDHPSLVRPEAVPRARSYLSRAARADHVLTSAQATAEAIRRHLGPSAPPVTVAPLGIDVPVPDPAALPPEAARAPYFVAVGTLEPRKNIGLLLDVWERLGEAAPRLFLVGQRGWESPDFFARLDRGVPRVAELPGLTDAARTALVAGARALLFPSLAEGYGLPPAEAAALGTPVVCGDLAICREVLGEAAIYVDQTDVYQWEKQIRHLTEQSVPPPTFRPPTWADHFKIALSVT